MKDKYWGVHASEYSWVQGGEDFVVHNDKDIGDLCMSLNKVIDSIQGSSYNSNIDKREGVL
jgi:hypothetical protein